jgi:K+-sensing histidine kinase KdpD
VRPRVGSGNGLKIQCTLVMHDGQSTCRGGQPGISAPFSICLGFLGLIWAFLRGEVRTPFAYAAAFAFVGLAWLLSRLTPASAFPHIPLLLFGAAVLATGAIGGQAPALLSGCLSLLDCDYFFIPTAGSFKLPYTAADAIGFGAFALVVALAEWVTGMTRRGAVEKARADDLTRKLAVENAIVTRSSSLAPDRSRVEASMRSAATR